MTSEQLQSLQHLSQAFSAGKANSRQIKQLSELLSTINKYNNGRLNLADSQHEAMQSPFDKLIPR